MVVHVAVVGPALEAGCPAEIAVFALLADEVADAFTHDFAIRSWLVGGFVVAEECEHGERGAGHIVSRAGRVAAAGAIGLDARPVAVFFLKCARATRARA